MQVTEKEIILALVVSTLTLVIITVFFSSLVVVFQKNIRKKQQQLFKAVLETQEKERQRIGKDLHDEMGPLLSAVKLHMDSIQMAIPCKGPASESISYVKGLIDDAVKGIRTSSHDLMPSTLEKFGLVAAVEELCTRINTGGKIKALFEEKNCCGEIDSFAMLNIYRVIQELINNAVKHSGASEIRISFKNEKKSFVIEFADNGIGFNLESVNSGKGGIGLKNIESRIKLLSGHYIIDTAPGKGTGITISFETEKLR